MICRLVVNACKRVSLRCVSTFNVDNVRVAKIVGACLSDSFMVDGILLSRGSEGKVKFSKSSRMAVYAHDLTIPSTCVDCVSMINCAYDLSHYNFAEESILRDMVVSIASSGASVVVTGGRISDHACHYLDRYRLMLVRIPSKYELRRLCRLSGACILVTFRVPAVEELGFVARVDSREVGNRGCVIFERARTSGGISTLVLRGATKCFLQEVEMSVDGCVDSFRICTKDPRTLPASGGSEIELIRRVKLLSRRRLGVRKYVTDSLSNAFLFLPRQLCSNSGRLSVSCDSLSSLHENGYVSVGLNAEYGLGKVFSQDGIFDLFIGR